MPLAGSKAVLVIESGWVAKATVNGKVFEALFCGLELSLTVTVTVNESDGVRLSPAGDKYVIVENNRLREIIWISIV